MRKLLILSLAASAMSLATAANATIFYTFTGNTTGGASFAATFTTPDFVTTLTQLSAAQLTTCHIVVGPYTCDGISLNPNSLGVDLLAFDVQPFDAFSFGFTIGSFGAVGTYNTVIAGGNVGTLVISNAAVPEPSTWAMMLLGFGTLGFALRRRKPVTLALLRTAKG